MAKTLLQRITESLAKEGLKPRTNAARDWLRSKVKELKPSPQGLMNDRKKLRDSSIIGKMYFYFYDPNKRKNEIL